MDGAVESGQELVEAVTVGGFASARGTAYELAKGGHCLLIGGRGRRGEGGT